MHLLEGLGCWQILNSNGQLDVNDVLIPIFNSQGNVRHLDNIDRVLGYLGLSLLEFVGLYLFSKVLSTVVISSALLSLETDPPPIPNVFLN